MKVSIVDEVQYHKNFVQAINDNIARISIFFLIFSALLLLIAIALINNTIRLSVYAQRFNIRTMQLIGATQRFIRKPFIFRGVVQGFVGSLLANGLLILFLYKAQPFAPELIDIQHIDSYLILFASITLIGMIISWWSTYFSVRKYLRSKLDNLYLM
jgi:cell division transport system permease protein